MVKLWRNLAILSATMLLLTACGSSHHVTYSGHEESTEGVPGFVNGKKVSPNVKLGQSYNVDGEEYVPRFQPDYVEEGMASWYGPGFHGGKTANGEEFDTHSFTAAHRTLPLPSIVKVTMLETGKSVYVRINDRGPYARGRIIDLSYGAAKEIGLVARGTGKVRVEYCLGESQRYADLLAQGRSPDSIDVANEVLPYVQKPVAYAQVQHAPSPDKPGSKTNFADDLNPIAEARAEQISAPDNGDPNNPGAIEVADLTAPVGAVAQAGSAPHPISQARGDPPPAHYASTNAMAPPPGATTIDGPGESLAPGLYLQLGTFSQHENAVRLSQRAAQIGKAIVIKKTVGNGYWYRVRMGPYASSEQATEAANRLHQMGLRDAVVVHQ